MKLSSFISETINSAVVETLESYIFRLSYRLRGRATTIRRLLAELEATGAEVTNLRYNLDWIRAKLRLPEGSGMFSGEHTIAGMLHIWDSYHHGFTSYIEADKCNDERGEIARLAKRVRELELLQEAQARTKERGEN